MHEAAKKTTKILLLTFILTEPLYTSLGLLSFVLRKDLHASPLQLTLLTTLKPVVALISLYWSHRAYYRPRSLKKNALWGAFFARIPYLFYPWIDDPWLIILCELFHIIFARGSHPAWAELLRLNLPMPQRAKTYSFGLAIAHIEGGIIGLGFGQLLDYNPRLWQAIYPISALLSLIALLIQMKIPHVPPSQEPEEPPTLSFKERLFLPWRDAYLLLKRRPDFRQFQWGYMIEAFGLMLIQPALPLFFADVLQLSHAEVALATSSCKSIGFVLSSAVWAKMLNRAYLFRYTACIFLLRALFIGSLSMAQGQLSLLYIAYLIYGAAIAGSHLCWSLSGTLFARQEESSLFSSVNVLAIGIRGAVAPPLGGWIAATISPRAALLIGLLFPLAASLKMEFSYRREKEG